MSTAQSRRVARGGAYEYVVYVRPPARRPDDELERRAVLAGYLGVIDGIVIEPGTPEAAAYCEAARAAGDRT